MVRARTVLIVSEHTAVAHILCGDQEFGPCSAPVRIELEDGRNVVYASGACGTVAAQAPPDIAAMPSAAVAWNRDADTEGQVVLDNRAAIGQALMVHNAMIATPGSGCGCSLRARPRGFVMIALAGASLVLLARRRRRR
jgi:hypothetical protein